MIFNVDPGETLDPIAAALEQAGKTLSEEKFSEIANKIDEAMPGVIEYLIDSTYEMWRAEASGVSTGWGEIYASAIKRGKDEVYLDEDMKTAKNKPALMFADMVEKGMKSFSIRDALLASDKAKVGPSGVKYITVPFPVRTPRSNKNVKMGSQFGGREMTQEIHKIVKGGGKIKAGTATGGQDISGLTKYVTRQRHEQYGIFRRVSENTPPDKWVHPGVPAEPVLDKVRAQINTEIQNVLREFCQAIVDEATR
jgi:hypothetical protein